MSFGWEKYCILKIISILTNFDVFSVNSIKYLYNIKKK